MKKFSSMLAALLLPVIGFAQEAGGVSSPAEISNTDVLAWGIMAVEAVLILVLILLIFILRVVAQKVLTPTASAVETEQATITSRSYWKRLITRMNDAVPVEQEEAVLTSHSYDGIHELDNNLPPWWKAMFYATIAFSVVYLLYFHVFHMGESQNDEYSREMAVAKAETEAYLAASADNVDETNVTMVKAPDRIANGQDLFQTKCAPCHGEQGEGGVGPNLTDQYWLHGGDIKDIFKTIKNGVPQKGMISWKTQLSPVQMQDISSFIITLAGTNPPNGKAPEGELYERTDEVALK